MDSAPDAANQGHAPVPNHGIAPAYGRLIGWVAVVVLLQALWAGFFLERDGPRDNATGWVISMLSVPESRSCWLVRRPQSPMGSCAPAATCCWGPER